MGAQAAEAALDDAGWRPDSLDVVIGACGVMEQPIPGTAALIHRRLGLDRAGVAAIDVNATCLSFLIGLQTAATGFAAGMWRRALVVSADIASAALDFDDLEASVIFGDGAAAAALSAEGEGRLLSCVFRTWSDGADLCRLEAGGTRLRPEAGLSTFIEAARFRMDGPGVFRAAARRIRGVLTDAFTQSTIDPKEISVVTPHQASRPALDYLSRVLPGSADRVIDIFASEGNQIAVSMPSALHAARRKGLCSPGRIGLLVGTSAGLSLGAAVVRF